MAFGIGTGSDFIFQLYIDDGVISRRNRKNMVDPTVKLTGMAFCEHKNIGILVVKYAKGENGSAEPLILNKKKVEMRMASEIAKAAFKDQN